MRIFTLVIDSRPPFAVKGIGPSSLLLTPLGGGTVLGELHSRLGVSNLDPLSILPTFKPDAGYEEAARDACPAVESVLTHAAFDARLGACEPSDWLLILDPSCFPAAGFDPTLLFDGREGDYFWAKHVVAPATREGLKEYLDSDLDGRVRRIQRYYDPVTWPFTAGIWCSLLPMSCARLARDLPFGCLPELRRTLASRGIPSRDLPLHGGSFDLTEERGLLALNERVVLDVVSSRARETTSNGWFVMGSRCRIHPSVRILGPVVVQDDVEIHEGVTIVGPTAIGAGSSVGPNATLAQCLVGRNSRIAAGTTVRHRLLLGSVAPEPAHPRRAMAPPAPRFDDRSAAPFELSFEPRRRSPYPGLKRLAEAAIALLGLIALSPLLLLSAALIKLGSKGPILYGDEREGKDGRRFRCWKLRTMVEGAHDQQRALLARNQLDGPQFKIDRDPRLTWIGAFLRCTCIDELPQLINVVRGEMSLVGPRPSPFRENQMCVPWREARLSVRPGITGLWQVCRHERSNGDFHQWIYYDLLYVRHQSFWLDLKILAATAVTLGGKGHIALSWMVSPHEYYDRRSSRRGRNVIDPRALRAEA